MLSPTHSHTSTSYKIILFTYLCKQKSSVMCIFVVLIMEEKPPNIILTNNIVKQIVIVMKKMYKKLSYFQQIYDSKSVCISLFRRHSTIFMKNDL